jgi:hypothetical protein
MAECDSEDEHAQHCYMECSAVIFASSMQLVSSSKEVPAYVIVANSCAIKCTRGLSTEGRTASGRRAVGSWALLGVRAATPGSVRPSRSSREAPPPVEMWLMRCATPAFSTAHTESPPPMIVMAPCNPHVTLCFSVSVGCQANWISEFRRVGVALSDCSMAHDAIDMAVLPACRDGMPSSIDCTVCQGCFQAQNLRQE